MSETSQARSAPVLQRLIELGFAHNADASAYGGAGLKFAASGLELVATESVSKHLQPIVLVLGHWTTGRAMGEIHIELLPGVDGLDQLKALLAYGIGRDCPARNHVAWLAEGHVLQDLLPWRKAAAEYEERRKRRPHCLVGRPWMRLLLREVRAALGLVDGDTPCSVYFDGSVLSFQVGGVLVRAPAGGATPWPRPHGISARALNLMPRRLLSDPMELGIWEGRLEIGGLTIGE